VRPLLLDMLDLRDRLAAGLPPPPEPRGRWYKRWRGKRAPRPEPWGEGLRMTLRRLDQMLLERRVALVELLGQRFDPRLGRVVATRDEAGVEAGIVLEVVRAGFLWDEALLRPAEVIVSKPDVEDQA
jgi:molecular chaperone GrpE